MLASLVGSSGAKIFKPPKGKTWDLTPIWPSDLASIDTRPPYCVPAPIPHKL